MDDKVKRLSVEAKSQLIEWMEENFHDIDSFIYIANMKDNTTLFVHHCDDVIEAFGLLGLGTSTVNRLADNGDFEGKGNRDDN